MKRKISIIHPSRSRATIAGTTAMKWILRCDDFHNIEYIICLDLSDPKGLEYKHEFHDSHYVKCIRDNKSAIQAINEGAKMATGDILIVVSDDFDCPEHWDTLLLNEVEGKEDFILKTQDGIQKTLITLPIMDRTYYNRFGYIYHPDYKHLWCDTEMTVVGNYLGRVINSDIVFPHNHHTTGKFVKDSISKKNDATWNQGKKLFNERLKKNFGIKQKLMNFSEIKWQ